MYRFCLLQSGLAGLWTSELQKSLVLKEFEWSDLSFRFFLVADPIQHAATIIMTQD